MKWRTRATGVAGLAAFLIAVPGGAWADAADDTIDAIDPSAYGGGVGPEMITFRLAAGNKSRMENKDDGSSGETPEHNVVSTEDGPDGEPLFGSELAPPGATVDVEGTQYLTPGSYPFYCTIHQFSGMKGTILVSGPGAVARPDVKPSVASKKLKKLKKGKLKVALTATAPSADASVAATVGGKPAGSADDIDLAAGQKRTVTLKLSKQAKKTVSKGLKKKKKVAVEVSSEVPWGSPQAAVKKLK